MAGKLPLLAILLGSLLSGCLGGARDEALLTANEAVELAMAAAPGTAFAGVYGSEGAALAVPEPSLVRFPFADDGRDDGALGDGRLSSWVVSYIHDERWIERRVFADGTLDQPVDRDLPEFTVSQRAYRDTTERVDSPDVAKAARLDQCTTERPEVAGFLYSYSLYNESPPKGHGYRDDAVKLLDSVPLDRFALPTEPKTWAVAVVDMTEGSKHDASTLKLDAMGHPYLCEVGRPLQRVTRYDFNSYRDGGDDTLGIPIPWSDSFYVGDRVEHVRYLLQVQGGGRTDDANALLRMGDGRALHDGTAWYAEVVDLEVPAGGTWTIDVTPPELEPQLGRNELPVGHEEAYIRLLVYSYENLGP